MREVKLSKEWLLELYSKKLMSSTKIAKICHLSHRTVINYLRRYGISIRPSGSIPRSKNPPPNNQVERAYMLGLCASDVYVGRHWRQIRVQLGTSIREMVEVFKDTWKSYSTICVYPVKNKFSASVVTCISLLHPNFSFLLNAKEALPDNPTAFYAYLAGAVDGDGGIRLGPQKYGGSIRLYNTDRIWLEKIKIKLESLGFYPTIHGKNGYFTLHVGKKQDVLRLGHTLTKFMKHELKIKKLENLLKLVLS
jgi:intein-encoded DNA endonuclease-like protein